MASPRLLRAVAGEAVDVSELSDHALAGNGFGAPYLPEDAADGTVRARGEEFDRNDEWLSS